jgi:hypothetical protein
VPVTAGAEAAADPGPPPPGATPILVGMGRVYAILGILLVVVVLGGLLLHRRLWGSTEGGSGWAFWLLLAAGVVVHEALHGLAMVLCGVPASEVRFGFKLSLGAAFATTRHPMSIAAYRFVLALPLLALGLVPFAAGLALGSALVAKFGSLMILGAGADVAVLLALRGVPPAARVVDHPSQPGCWVMPA